MSASGQEMEQRVNRIERGYRISLRLPPDMAPFIMLRDPPRHQDNYYYHYFYRHSNNHGLRRRYFRIDASPPGDVAVVNLHHDSPCMSITFPAGYFFQLARQSRRYHLHPVNHNIYNHIHLSDHLNNIRRLHNMDNINNNDNGDDNNNNNNNNNNTNTNIITWDQGQNPTGDMQDLSLVIENPASPADPEAQEDLNDGEDNKPIDNDNDNKDNYPEPPIPVSCYCLGPVIGDGTCRCDGGHKDKEEFDRENGIDWDELFDFS